MEYIDKIKKNIISDIQKSKLDKDIICVLFFGSITRNDDYTKTSDIDLHILLKKNSPIIFNKIKNIIKNYRKIDLSVLTQKELDSIVNKGKFQNGNQGSYFIYVLANSESIFGFNVYKDLLKNISKKEIKSSVIFKLHEYLSRLRRLFIEDSLESNYFKKYTARILLDLMLLDSNIKYKDILKYNNSEIIDFYIDLYKNNRRIKKLNIISVLKQIKDLKTINEADFIASLQDLFLVHNID
jgi:predicted nucleotidyltransferase